MNILLFYLAKDLKKVIRIYSESIWFFYRKKRKNSTFKNPDKKPDKVKKKP